MSSPRVRIRSWVRGSDDDARAGLLGFLSVYYGDFAIDGITLRRTTDGRLVLSYPERKDKRGGRHPIVRPVDDTARQRIEKAILSEAATREESP